MFMAVVVVFYGKREDDGCVGGINQGRKKTLKVLIGLSVIYDDKNSDVISFAIRG